MTGSANRRLNSITRAQRRRASRCWMTRPSSIGSPMSQRDAWRRNAWASASTPCGASYRRNHSALARYGSSSICAIAKRRSAAWVSGTATDVALQTISGIHSLNWSLPWSVRAPNTSRADLANFPPSRVSCWAEGVVPACFHLQSAPPFVEGRPCWPAVASPSGSNVHAVTAHHSGIGPPRLSK